MKILTDLMADQAPRYFVTFTGEAVQPVRIVYKVRRPDIVRSKLKKLKCIVEDGPELAWILAGEVRALAPTLQLTKSPPPGEYQTIGTFHFSPEDPTVMMLDLRSIERAKVALRFFQKRLAAPIATIVKVLVVNRHFSSQCPEAAILQGPDIFSHFFERSPIAPSPSVKECVRHLSEETFREPTLPEIEEIGARGLEDGITLFETLLTYRYIVGANRLRGIETSLLQLLKEAFEKEGLSKVSE